MIGSIYNKIVHVGEHIITLPDCPTNKKKILFVDNKPENAFWRRQTDYRDIWFQFIPFETEVYAETTTYDNNTGALKSLNQKDSEYISRIYEQEWDRRINGVFCKFNNEIIYLTGDHYYFLQWAKTPRYDRKGDYPDYREFQRDILYLDHLAKTLEHIFGIFITKAKKTGVTNLIWSGPFLNESTLYSNYNSSSMSISKPKAIKTFIDYYIYAFKSLPLSLRPQISSWAIKAGNVEYGLPQNRSKKSQVMREALQELNSNTYCVETDPHAMDIAVMNLIWLDELPKYGVSPAEIWRVAKQSIRIHNTKVGRAIITSYTPDEDNRAFLEARKIAFESENRTITEWSKGQTTSGLIYAHIPAYASWDGCFDKYGRTDEKRAWNEILFERLKVKGNKRDLQAITRQYANSKKEAWMPAGAGSVFDNIRIAEIQTDIESFPGNPYKDGKLVWDNPLWEIGKFDKRPPHAFTTVHFEPLTEEQKMIGDKGKFREYMPLSKNLQNYGLRFGRDEFGNLYAPDRFIFVGGVDPTQYAGASTVIEGSRNASYTMNMPDEQLDIFYKKVASKIIYSEYIYRPELPREFFEDIVKEIIYYGKLVIVEANTPHLATMLIEEGLGRYMIVRNKETGVLCIWEPGIEYKLITMTRANGKSELMETLVALIKDYLFKSDETDKDYGSTIMSVDLCQDLMELDTEDTTKSDLTMAFGYCLLAMNTYMTILLAPVEREPDMDIFTAAIQALRAPRRR